MRGQGYRSLHASLRESIPHLVQIRQDGGGNGQRSMAPCKTLGHSTGDRHAGAQEGQIGPLRVWKIPSHLVRKPHTGTLFRGAVETSCVHRAASIWERGAIQRALKKLRKNFRIAPSQQLQLWRKGRRPPESLARVLRESIRMILPKPGALWGARPPSSLAIFIASCC